MKKDEMTAGLFDQMLKFAAEQRMEDMACELISSEEMGHHTFSADFEARMNASFRKMKRKSFYRHTRTVLARAAIVLFAVIAVSATVVLSVDAFRVPALKFFTKTNEESVSIIVRDDSGIYSPYKEEIKGMYLPSYVPEGFTVDYIDKVGSIYAAYYKNEDGQFFFLHNLVEGSAAAIDNEDAIVEDVIIKDHPAQLYMKNGMSTLLFTYQKNVFMLSGTIGKDDAMQMAESLEYFK